MRSSSFDTSHITGLLLAGGRGSHMGRVDQGMQLFRSEPLALHALRQLPRKPARC